jgi:hypothetical protein
MALLCARASRIRVSTAHRFQATQQALLSRLPGEGPLRCAWKI